MAKSGSEGVEIGRRNLIIGAGALGAAVAAGALSGTAAAQAKGKGGPVKFSVPASKVQVEDGKVVFDDPQLATLMARHGDDVRKELGLKKEHIAIQPDQITIDANGRVVIANAAYARRVDETLKRFSTMEAKDTNYCCNCNAYQCGKK